jgi:hypothetical protein
LKLSLLLAEAGGLYLRLEALLSELLLFALKAIVLGLRTGQVATPIEAIALFAALVPRGQHAQSALRSAESTGTYRNGPGAEQTVGDGITAKETGRKSFACRHDTLRK